MKRPRMGVSMVLYGSALYRVARLAESVCLRLEGSMYVQWNCSMLFPRGDRGCPRGDRGKP